MIERLLTISAGKKEQPFHWHKAMELNLILQGEADILVNNRIDHVTKDDLVVVNREDMHCIENTSPDFLYVQLFFNMEAYNQYISEIWTQYFKCTPEETDAVSINLKAEMRHYIWSIVNKMEHGTRNPDCERLLISASIEIIGCLALGFKYWEEEDRNLKRNEEYYNRLWKILDYMYDNSSRKLSIGEVAGHIYLSETYITKILKDSTGKSFEELLGYIRIEDSIKHLLGSDMSVTNIAYEVGFSAPRYFNATFEKHFGCSPKAWRQRYKHFFQIDKPREAAHMIYRDGTDKADIGRLLEEYSMEPVVQRDEDRPVEIIVNTAEPAKQHGTLSGIDPFVVCDAESAMDYDCLSHLKECAETLRIKKIHITGKNVKLRELALSNVKKLGFEPVREDDDFRVSRGTPLDSLYSDGGIRNYGFYRQRFLLEIEKPYCYINKKAVIYNKNGDFHVLMFHDEEKVDQKFLVEFIRLNSDGIYTVKKSYLRALPEDAVKRLDFLYGGDEENKERIEELFRPHEELELLMGKKTALFEIIIKPRELCLLTLKALSSGRK